MNRTRSADRDVVIPAGALVALRTAIRRESGPLAAIHALHDAGYAAGGTLFEAFARSVGGTPSDLAENHFWTRLSDFLSRRGWGALSHDAADRGVGFLRSEDWAEAGEGGDERQPGCAFSAGLFSHFLTSAAGGPVAVLEVSCRARGDDACVFAYGAEAAVHTLYGSLLDGADLTAAVARL